MTVTLHWWSLPALVSACYVAWALLPASCSGMWGDMERFFGHILGLLLSSMAWAIGAVCEILLK